MGGNLRFFHPIVARGKEKIKVVQVSSLDELEDAEKWKQFNGFSSFFCCLGGRTKDGDV
jgi:hypothetical protein